MTESPVELDKTRVEVLDREEMHRMLDFADRHAQRAETKQREAEAQLAQAKAEIARMRANESRHLSDCLDENAELRERIRKALDELESCAEASDGMCGYSQRALAILSGSDTATNADEIKFEAGTLSKADVEGAYAIVDTPYQEGVDFGPLDDDVPATNTEERADV